MTTDEKNQLFINLLARNIYRFAYWAENEWPKEIANKKESYKENKL